MTVAFRLVIRLDKVEPEDLPRLIEAIRMAGRHIHAAAVLISGADPAPEIMMLGEDLKD